MVQWQIYRTVVIRSDHRDINDRVKDTSDVTLKAYKLKGKLNRPIFAKNLDMVQMQLKQKPDDVVIIYEGVIFKYKPGMNTIYHQKWLRITNKVLAVYKSEYER